MATAALRVEELQGLGGLAAHEAAWRELSQPGRGEAGFFLSWEWLRAWAEAFLGERTLSTLLVFRDGRLVGGLPLVEPSRRVRLVRRLSAAINDQTPHGALLCAAGQGEAVLGAMLGHLRSRNGLFELRLARATSCSCLSSVLPAVASRMGLGVSTRPEVPGPVVRIQGDWNAYLASRSKHTQREWRRKRRKLEEAGHLEVEVHSSPSALGDAIRGVLDVEDHSWKHHENTSLTTEQGADRFYERLIRSCAELGTLRLVLLRLDSRPLAHVIGFVHDHEFLAVKTSYDQRYSELSPGIVVVLAALEHAFAEGLRAFDLLGSPSRWKAEMTDDARQRTDVHVFTRGLPACELDRLVESRVKPALRTHMPRLVAARNALLERMQRRS